MSDECELRYYEPLATWAIEIKDLEATAEQKAFSFKEWSARPYSSKVGLRTNEGRNLGKAELEIIPPMTRTLVHQNEKGSSSGGSDDGDESDDDGRSFDDGDVTKSDMREVGF
jgi:hypothetical protein